ncbi:PREDICTED: uncharacterized protein LOC109475750 [Branchiostoma belcheri]|uniref:Uncharacterized protein LOC109475750 n=1 Tax=Branchiostoma belcheri TaxID=7741 RepID=A0A6P4ZR09_BRABE|nr:PREDICTED: uncharacterized protein LOC109475750 [Branchiostoma belcheri]
MADTSPEQPPTGFNGPSVKDSGLADGQQTNGVNGMGSPDLADAMNHVNINVPGKPDVLEKQGPKESMEGAETLEIAATDALHSSTKAGSVSEKEVNANFGAMKSETDGQGNQKGRRKRTIHVSNLLLRWTTLVSAHLRQPHKGKKSRSPPH